AVRRVAAAVGLVGGEAGEDTDWAFLQVLGAAARTRPLVLVVDDAHWAEPALLDLLVDLIDRLRDVPVLVVWVARAELRERAPDRGAKLVLDPLSTPASEALLVAMAGGRLDESDRRRILVAAGGNPLFLEQLVAYVDEQPSPDALPPGLQTLLAARLDGLDAAERSALAVGAIAGDRFDPEVVRALAAGITGAAAERACERLVARGF